MDKTKKNRVPAISGKWMFCDRRKVGSMPPPHRKVRIISKRWAQSYRPVAVRVSPEEVIVYTGKGKLFIELEDVVCWIPIPL